MTVGLHDVDDVRAFVAATVTRWRARSSIALAPGEHEELVAEGIVALYVLAKGYERHRPGYERAGSFAGYAARFLPRRLTTAWHRLRGHTYGTRDGKRAWVFHEPPMSLEQLRDRPRVLATARPVVAPSRMPRRRAARAALSEAPSR